MPEENWPSWSTGLRKSAVEIERVVDPSAADEIGPDGAGVCAQLAKGHVPWPPPFAPPTPLRSPPQTPPQWASFALFAGFIATMTRSDFSGPCIIGFGSSPSRCGPPYTHGTRRRRPDTRSPRFRCDPFARDVALDPGRASAPRITVPHML